MSPDQRGAEGLQRTAGYPPPHLTPDGPPRRDLGTHVPSPPTSIHLHLGQKEHLPEQLCLDMPLRQGLLSASGPVQVAQGASGAHQEGLPKASRIARALATHATAVSVQKRHPRQDSETRRQLQPQGKRRRCDRSCGRAHRPRPLPSRAGHRKGQSERPTPGSGSGRGLGVGASSPQSAWGSLPPPLPLLLVLSLT